MNAPAASATAMIGTLMKNTDPNQKWLRTPRMYQRRVYTTSGSLTVLIQECNRGTAQDHPAGADYCFLPWGGGGPPAPLPHDDQHHVVPPVAGPAGGGAPGGIWVGSGA